MTAISIIIPAYNAEKFIRETVNSVLAQTFTDFEIIVSDDGSTDSTATIISGFDDPRIKYLHSPNAGVSTARNKGAALATGDYLAFIDADDLFYPENLNKKIQFLKSHPEFDLVFADCDIIDENGNKTGEQLTGNDEDVLTNLLLWNNTVIPGPSSILVSHKAYGQTGGFDAKFSTAADQDFFFRIAAEFRCGRIPEPLTAYRKHGSNMHMNIALMERDHIGVYRKAAENNLFPDSRFRIKCFANLYMILAGSWWVNGNNKLRGLYFMMRSVSLQPSMIFRLIKKIA